MSNADSQPPIRSHINSFKIGHILTMAYSLRKTYLIHRVQYAEIQHSHQKSGENKYFYLPVIFKVIRVMSSYISQIFHRTIKVVTSISSIPADL